MFLSESGLRILAAAVLVLLYVAMCAAIWWRERRRRARAQHEAAALASAREGALPLLVAYASQTGQAEELARETARLLHTAGESVHLCALDAVDVKLLAQTQRALFIASTYGEGDPPDNAALFLAHSMAQAQGLSHLQYGLLALGDRQYAQFCGFGRALDSWLRAGGARPWFERIEMDNGAPQALTAWQHQLTQISSLGDMPAWEQPVFSEWTLAARRHMNPGSAGEPVFHIELQPPATEAALWESGDLTQVCIPADPQHPREYSIASIAQDGCVHLLVRQARREDGSPGLASGWLTQGAPLGAAITLRLRAHRNFRLEDNLQRPLVLIGNGTGLAGLRSHLRARAAAGLGPNWLLFGERNAAHDRLYGDELQAWCEGGVLQRLDLAFSRDRSEGVPRAYVQDLLAQSGDMLRQWVEQGAAIYVCGSLQGMAQGVDQALHAVLGEAQMDQLVRSGRYRRDVY
ncbi:sulfite reductase (NADPH) flavoprotein alpha-component [Delftia acidovorans CCUG 274B]|uniref:sulfite reductase subunit alpha n=1 Tax=Delftia TaxID=80865 RepID=UPI000353538C|nr:MULTISPECIES: sulfite reductase subunit alpha [Delftia]EPD39931.1 sulfite reductase (NADPH) flavoprotein alpha-component [Delftia acidovorans CCUG 274B]MCX7504147.1 sulfite reductase subunit alpha [Delftia tsuruhatensis]PZP65233.1 MAG: oxidoreductase [Delftia acidovorans]